MIEPRLPPMLGDKITTSQGDFAVLGVTIKRARSGQEFAVVLAGKWDEAIAPVVAMAAADLVWQPSLRCWRHKTESRIVLAT